MNINCVVFVFKKIKMNVNSDLNKQKKKKGGQEKIHFLLVGKKTIFLPI